MESWSHLNVYHILLLLYRYVDRFFRWFGMEELFGRFKQEGYTTLFNDCSCWYSEYGTILDPRQGVGEVTSEKTRRSRWRQYVALLNKYKLSEVIDDYGMMFLTCSAFGRLNATNIFDGRKIPKVCYYGRDYSSLFLEYAEKYASGGDLSDRPFLSYTHLYTSHECTGRRIVNDDVHLARFLHEAAHLENTVTIFASDHGDKSGPFSAYTNHGRHEVCSICLFAR